MTEKPIIRLDHALHLIVSFIVTLAILGFLPSTGIVIAMCCFVGLTLVWEFRKDGEFEWMDIAANFAGMAFAAIIALGVS